MSIDRSVIRGSWLVFGGVGAMVAGVVIAASLRSTPPAPLHHPRVDWFALYQRGNAELELHHDQEALDTFVAVAHGTAGDPRQASLNRAAKHDLVRAYAEVGQADDAFQTFRRIDPAYALDMLVLLADWYLGAGKNEQAIHSYRELIATARANPNVCLWQYNIAHAALSMSDANRAVDEIEHLVHLWGATRDVLPASEQKECHDNAASMASELARAYHAEGAKTAIPETLAHAERLYVVYLDAFPEADNFGSTQYFYAELLWMRAEAAKTELAWRRAAEAFDQVVASKRVEAKLLDESTYAAKLARNLARKPG